MIKYCPICSEDNLSHARFCSNCGAVIAHIEPSISGFGTAKNKDVSFKQDLGPAQISEPGPNELLAGRMVSLAHTSQFVAKERTSDLGAGKRWWPKKTFTSPYAVACLAGVTILALTTSLAWIVQGQHPLQVKGSSMSQVDPAPTDSSPPTLYQPPAAAHAPTQAITPSPLGASSSNPPFVQQSQSKEVLREQTPLKPKPAEQAQKQVMQKAAKVNSPSPTLQSRKYPQALGSDHAKQAAMVSLASEAALRPPVAESQSGASKANQVAILDTKPAETLPKDAKGSVEALCSDRSNFLTRGFCQNQYCADPSRKIDQTCQKLREYELARQSVSY